MREFVGFKKGINLGGWLSQAYFQTDEYYGSFIAKSDIERIASWGVDHIRLPVDYCLVETEQGDVIESGYKYIDDCIEWCKEFGLNLILDLHKTAGFAFDELETSKNFFESDKLQERFINLWLNFAKRYGKYSGFLAFELLNEVVLIDVADSWNKIIKNTISKIRELAPDTKIIIGGVCYNSPLAIAQLDEPYDENIVYNFHCYEPLLFTHQNAPWIAEMPSDLNIDYPLSADDYKNSRFLTKEMSIALATFGEELFAKDTGEAFFEKIFETALAAAEKRNVPLYCGEYGVIDRAPLKGTLNWYKAINAVFEKHNIGRAAWTYKQRDFGLIDEHYKPILNDLVKYL